VRVFDSSGSGFLGRGKAHLSLQIVVGRKCRELGAYGRRRPSCHGVFVEMTDDAVDDFGVGENRDDFHFRTTFAAQEWVHLEDFLIRRAQWARLEVDGVEDLSAVVSAQDATHAVNALCDKALRFRLA